MKNICNTFLPYLAEIINDSFQIENFTNELKLGEETPVCKKKDSLIKKNCRPVSILSHVSKLLLTNKELHGTNLGFLIYCTDSEKIIIPKNPWKWKWILVLDRRCNIGTIFMHLFKVFGTLNHELL